MSEVLNLKMEFATTVGMSTAIVEAKKTGERPSGGCVGMFFQLFDWNRRMAKKKLFSKKLVTSPARAAKRAVKKFGGDDKLPMGKMLSIAEENRGGFPMSKKSEVDKNVGNNGMERGREMKAPGLVARLMGLDSLPSVQRDNQKNVNGGDDVSSRSRRGEIYGDGSYYEESGGQMSVESRPGKLQKTGVYEKRAITRFGGGDTLQLKSVLSSCTRKQHNHPKLVSPVKSPRTGRNASRLMEAATKILEPGLHATSRAKCALTYSSRYIPPRDKFLIAEQSKQLDHFCSGAHSVRGQSSCRTCGNFLDALDSRSHIKEQTSRETLTSSDMDIPPFKGSGKNTTIILPVSCSFEQEKFEALVGAVKSNIHMMKKNLNSKKPLCREEAEHRQPCKSSYRVLKTQNDVDSSAPALKLRNQRQSHMLGAEKGVTATPRSQPQASHFQNRRSSFTMGTGNRNMDSNPSNQRTRVRRPSPDNCHHHDNKEICSRYKRDDSLSRLRSPVRKRRPLIENPQAVNAGSMGSSSMRQKNVVDGIVAGKVKGLGISSITQNHIRTERLSEVKGASAGGRKEAKAVSFTFSSSMRLNTQSSFPTENTKKIRGRVDVSSRRDLDQKKITVDKESEKTSTQKAAEFKGDAIGVLLEEKLKELASRDRDESGDAVPVRSTAAILEELILALTAGRSSFLEEEDKHTDDLSQEDNQSQGSQSSSNHIPMHSEGLESQGDTNGSKVLVALPLSGDYVQPSPGSVLEVYFSNDSCISVSPNGSSGGKMHDDSLACSYTELQQSRCYSDLSDSGTSLKAGTVSDKMIAFCSNISSALSGYDLAVIGLVGERLDHVLDVITNVQLIFGNNSFYKLDEVENFPIGPIIDDLELLSVDIMDAKADNNQLRKLLFDSVIEIFESKFNYSRSSFKLMSVLHLHANEELPTREVFEEIKSWIDLSRRSIDEVIEADVGRSMGNWTEFKIEASEATSEIEFLILQGLLDEIVTDFC